jgi:hypothetical protein
MKSTATMTFQGIKLEIEYYSTPFVPGKWTLSNGDPGYPDEGGEFYIESIKAGGVEIFDLLSDEKVREIEEDYLKQN